MGKNPFDEVEAANNARFAEWLKTRRQAVVDELLKPEGGRIRIPLPLSGEANMRECVRHAADYYAKETGFAADRFIALIDVNELLAAESPMEALEAALTAGEAKIRSEAQ